MVTRKPIHLAILGTRGIPARYGGFETFTEELALRLIAKEYSVTVYCERIDTNDQPSSWRGINLIYLPIPSCGPLTTILFDLSCLWHARKRFDVVYMLGYGAAPFCFIPRLWGSKVWLNVDGIEWARSKWGWFARQYFKLMECFSMWTPNRVIADAAAIRDHLWRRQRRRPLCSVIPYGAQVVTVPPNTSLLDEWTLTPNDYYLVVCRLEPENHIYEIIQGFSRSTSRKQLVIVGNHQSGTAYVNALKRIVDTRIRFIGTVFDKAKLQALRYHAWAYCHGHSVGGTNPSLLEALGCANAVLAHDNPFNREVAGESAGYFANTEDFRSLIERFDSGVFDREAMRLVALARIEECYTWEHIISVYLDLLHQDTGIRTTD